MVARAAEFEQPQPSPLTNAQINSMVREDLVPLCTNPEAIQRNAPKIGQLLATLTQPGVNLGDYQRGIDRLLADPKVKEETELELIDYTAVIEPESLMSDRAKELLEKLAGATKDEIIDVQRKLVFEQSLSNRDFRRLNRLTSKLLDDLAEEEQPQIIRVTSSRRPFFKAGVALAAATVVGTPLSLIAARPQLENQRLDKEAGVGRKVYFPDITGKNVEFVVKRRAELPGFVYITNNKGEEFAYPVPASSLSFESPKVPTSGQAFVDEASRFATQPSMITAYDEKTGSVTLSLPGENRATHVARIADKPFSQLKPGDIAYLVRGGSNEAYKAHFDLIQVERILENEQVLISYINERGELYDEPPFETGPYYIQRMPNLFTDRGWPKKKDA